MELFKKFNKTVFYKKHSDLELQVEALQKLQKEYPDNIQLSLRLKTAELGLKGEQEIEFELKNSDIGMYVLHDVNLKIDDISAQIDYIVIAPGATYFIECKNLIGNITVNERGEFTREYKYGNKVVKEGIYSPIRQAERHVEIFKKIWAKRHTGILSKTLGYKNFEKWQKPLVVMANSKNILDIKKAPQNIKDKIIRSDALVDYIKKDIQLNKDTLSNQKQMHETAYNIMQYYNHFLQRDYEQELRDWLQGKSNDWFKENIQNIPNAIKTSTESILELRKKLAEYRLTKSKKRNIPAYYIFTNDELDKLLIALPKDMDSLKKSKILNDTKIKLHGKEILEIINK